MRKFSINCDFGGQLAPFDIFIGQPEKSHHPLHFQADWLLKQRGGTILPEVMDAIAKLNALALENGVPLEDLCVYALGSAQEEIAPEGAAASTEETPSAESQVEESAVDQNAIDANEPQTMQEASSSDPTPDELLSENDQANVDTEEAQSTDDEASPDTEVAPAGTQVNNETESSQVKVNDEPRADENKQ